MDILWEGRGGEVFVGCTWDKGGWAEGYQLLPLSSQMNPPTLIICHRLDWEMNEVELLQANTHTGALHVF